MYVSNVSKQPIRAPLKLRLIVLRSALGAVESGDADGIPLHEGTIVPVPLGSAHPAGFLQPGERAGPIHMTTHLRAAIDVHSSFTPDILQNMLDVRAKAFARSR